jgi:hypothetical protein
MEFSEELNKFPEFRELSEEDEKKMEANVSNVKGILFAKEVSDRIKEGGEDELGQDVVLGDSIEILDKETADHTRLVNSEFEKFLNDKEKGEEVKKFFKTSGWADSEFDAMTDVLRHALRTVNVRFESPDEMDENFRSDGRRDLKSMIIDSIARDYSSDVAEKAMPLVELYFQKASEMLNSKNSEGERMNKKFDNPSEGEEMSQ